MDSNAVVELFNEAVAVSRAVASPDDYDAVWKVLARANEAHQIAADLSTARLGDRDPTVRATACDLLGVLSNIREEVRADAASALIALALIEVDDGVRWSIAVALRSTNDVGAVPTLVALAGHADQDIRFQVAVSLPFVLGDDDPDAAGVAALMGLCADADPEVRNWATFGLGWASTADGDAVRQVLWQRTTDDYPEAREEGIRGLARRRDRRALPLVMELLSEESAYLFTFEAAALLGHPSLVPLLENFEATDTGVAEALRECDPASRARRDTAAMALFDALHAHRPDLQFAIFGERCEIGLYLAIFSGSPSQELTRWSVEGLLDRADGDPHLAARLVAQDLVEHNPTA